MLTCRLVVGVLLKHSLAILTALLATGLKLDKARQFAELYTMPP